MSCVFEMSLGDLYDKEGFRLAKRGEFISFNEITFKQGCLYITEDYI